jgi:septum site-determining protein MinC
MRTAHELSSKDSFEIRGTNFPVVALKLKTTDLTRLSRDFSYRFGEMPEFFDDDGIVIDLSHFETCEARVQSHGLETALDFAALSAMLRDYRLHPVAVRGGTPRQIAAAAAAGLVYTPNLVPSKVTAVKKIVPPATAGQSGNIVQQVRASLPPPSTGALVIDTPLRCGQRVYARGRDLVVMAMVNAGAELIADGHIHVYAPLRGRAIAGAMGNIHARVFAMSMASEMIGIAGIYDTGDQPLHKSVFGKPAQISLASGPEGSRLVVEEINC